MENENLQPPILPFINDDGSMHYGVFESPYDERDHQLDAYIGTAGENLPDSFYPALCPAPHFHQHKLGACVGHAGAKSQQESQYRETGKVFDISPRWLYALCKSTDNYAGEGTYPRIMADYMRKVGCATEKTVPNDTLLDHETYVYNRNQANFPKEAFDEAAKVKIKNYSFVPLTETGIKTAIKWAGENKGGIFMLLTLDKNWWCKPNGQISWAENDLMADGMRIPTDKPTIGNHEVYPYAFDKKNGRTIVIGKNSWGETWGKKGDFWFYLDEYLPFIREVIATVDLPDDYVPPTFQYTFSKPLKFGDKGSDVVALQNALKVSGEFPSTQNVTGNFGNITLDAVKKFQLRYADEILTPAGLTVPSGFVGTFTIRKLNKLFSS